MQQRRQHSSMSAIEIFYSGVPIKQRAYDLAAGLPTHSPCEMTASRSLTMILPNQNTVPSFARWATPALMIAPRASVIIALGIFAMTAGCGSIRSSGGDAPIVTQISATPYAGAACFYSDKSGTDRIVGGRIVHWCGPKPRAVF
jgi:hypothetical protein